MLGEVGRLLAGRLLAAPDPQQVIVELEGEAQGPPELPVAGDHRLVVRGEQRAGLDARGDQRRGLAPDHVEVQVDRHGRLVLARPDVDVLAFAEREAGLVVQPHQPEHLRVGEAERRETVQRDP